MTAFAIVVLIVLAFVAGFLFGAWLMYVQLRQIDEARRG